MRGGAFEDDFWCLNYVYTIARRTTENLIRVCLRAVSILACQPGVSLHRSGEVHDMSQSRIIIGHGASRQRAHDWRVGLRVSLPLLESLMAPCDLTHEWHCNRHSTMSTQRVCRDRLSETDFGDNFSDPSTNFSVSHFRKQNRLLSAS